jgi:hypothetical protein
MPDANPAVGPDTAEKHIDWRITWPTERIYHARAAIRKGRWPMDFITLWVQW